MTSVSLPPAPFGRVLTAMVTPFADDGSVDLEGTARVAEHLANTGHDGIVVSPSQATWTLEDSDGRTTTVSPRPRYYADESVLLLEAAKAGLGITNIPSAFCAPLIASGELVRVLAAWTSGAITTTLLMPHRRGKLPSVSVVADELAAAFSPSLVQS